MNIGKYWKLLFIPIIFLVLLPLGCAKEQQYRTGLLSLTGEPCEKPYIAGDILHPRNDERVLDDHWRCYDQEHSLPGGTRYSLNFLEFNEDGELFESAQLEAIKSRVRKSDTYLIVFVHGWRHDARQRDQDVRKFRTLLAYAASFLSERQTFGRYADTKVAGLYVGWRGRAFAESPDSNLGIIGAWPTIWGRKKVSENIAERVVATLASVEEAFGNDTTGRLGGYSDRMVVIGHSFGGNILATGLEPLVLESLSSFRPGTVFGSPVGDLALLINPASEARRWTSIQRAVRALSNVKSGNRFTNETHRTFPSGQRPVLVSLTSSCSWPDNDEPKNGCDWATGWLFPLAHRVNGPWNGERIRTIGHLDPPSERSSPLYGLGTTHELDLNNSFLAPSDYRSAGEAGGHAGCAIVDGWLTRAKKRVGSNGVLWDAGIEEGREHTPKNITPISTATDPMLESQFRHGIYRSRAVITAANDPFWNVRAHGSVIDSHGTYVSYQMWCAINQLVLDNPTAQSYDAHECRWPGSKRCERINR